MNNYRILAISLALELSALAQVKTEVPPVVPGAKPVAVEHIMVHGTALEGNLENDAVDREVIVFLKVLNAAQQNGQTLATVAPSRAACPSCQSTMQQNNVRIVGPRACPARS